MKFSIVIMKSSFSSKRKARRIQVDDEEEGPAKDQQAASEASTTRKCSRSQLRTGLICLKPANKLNIAIAATVASNPGRKALKNSSLRQSIAFDDLLQAASEGGTIQPTIGRSNSLIRKKKSVSSRLSFGHGEIISGDAAEALEDDEPFPPKKPTLGRRVTEGIALRRSVPYQSLPLRSTDDDDDRPTYSKDYLNELKSSTPTAPKDLVTLHATAEDENLDPSELEGAMMVDLTEKFGSDLGSPAFIPSEAEIKEKKERRARLAQEKDFISLNDDDGERRISLLPHRKKEESRLVREDEDIAEGFDEFVSDGRVALGKKQEREAKRRQRKEMADMIHQAEGTSDEESDDSEAERRAAYEAAQTRAGMDGLHKPGEKTEGSTAQVPAKITPLPVLSDCFERLQSTLSSMELELARRRQQLDASKREKREIGERETEVQELLKQAGARYGALKADTNGAVTGPQTLMGASNGIAPAMVLHRGLESFGNTPTARPDNVDVG